LESNLRRAVSTVYYALFHGLAECCADELFNRNMRGQPGWVRIYRGLNHRQAREACKAHRDMRSFCVEIRDFASRTRGVRAGRPAGTARLRGAGVVPQPELTPTAFHQ